MHVFLPILKRKGLKGDNFHVYNSNSYLVTYNWKGLLTIQIMTFTEGVYVIPGQNNGLSKVLRLPNFDMLPFWTGLT